MIYKSYIVEENFNAIKNNVVLFYGQNLGLLDEFKRKIISKNNNHKIIRFSQNEILNYPDTFIGEVRNISLFENIKIFFIQNVSDKILDILNEVTPHVGNNKIYLFTEILEKKSKLRIFFEKEKALGIIPCYQDNEINLRKIIQKNFKNYEGLSPAIINLIIENCSYDRGKINNEIDKIKSYFYEKTITIDEINKLLNLRIDDDFNNIKNSAISGKDKITNVLLSSSLIEAEKIVFYISSFNQRFEKLKEIIEKRANMKLEDVINEIKPPVFWKDKPSLLHQAKIWNINKIRLALEKTYEAELKIKSNSNLNKQIIIKKLIVDICNLAKI